MQEAQVRSDEGSWVPTIYFPFHGGPEWIRCKPKKKKKDRSWFHRPKAKCSNKFLIRQYGLGVTFLAAPKVLPKNQIPWKLF